MSTDRRRNPRVRILGRLHGRAVALDVAVTVTEISLGGMGIHTDIEFPPGAIHDFQLALGDESVVDLRGRVVHCQRADGGGYVSGIEFTDEPLNE